MNNSMYPTLVLKKGKEESVSRKHPWIFSGALYPTKIALDEGTVVRVTDNKGEHFATGHYHDGSIMVRILSFEDIDIDQKFWNQKIDIAYQYRISLGLIDDEATNAYRLIHGEGDGISGLIIDHYDGHIVVQCHSVGCYKAIDYIVNALQYVYGDKLKSIFIKSKDSLPSSFEGYTEDYFAVGDTESAIIKENNISFYVNWREGQKTGFFLDQRENRKLLGSYSNNKNVLNCFCYTGGFSMYAMKGGANQVTSVDISKSAMGIVAQNHELNSFDNQHKLLDANVLQLLNEVDDNTFDVVIVDPPAFAKSVKKRHNAVQAYKRLNILAIQKVKPGGKLFTFSCSQVVGPELFYGTIRAAAIEAGRQVKIVHHLSQGPDHPINIYHPEGNYLKGLVLHID